MNNYLLAALGALLLGITIFAFSKSKDDEKEKKRKSSEKVRVLENSQEISDQGQEKFEETKQNDHTRQEQQITDQKSPSQRTPQSKNPLVKSAVVKSPQKPKAIQKPVYKGVKIEQLEGGNAGFYQNELQQIIEEQMPIFSTDPALNPICCIESRNGKKILGVPGGDCVQWILGLRSVELLTQMEFTLEQIQESFQNFLKQTKKSKFYMHTDKYCIQVLKENLQLTQDDFDIHNPPQNLKQILIEFVNKLTYQGCGYVMIMLTNPRNYQQRIQLIEWFLKVFYNELWNGNKKVYLDILEGETADQAFCLVNNEQQYQPELAPKTEKGAICFYHLKAEAILRQEIVGFLVDYVQKSFQKSISQEELMQKINEIGEITNKENNKVFTSNVLNYKLNFTE